jgi:hypothetical protein
VASLDGKPKNDEIKDLVAAPVMALLAVQPKNDDVQDSVQSTRIPSPGGSQKPINESDVGDKSSNSLQLSVSADDNLPGGDRSKKLTELSVSADDDLPAGTNPKNQQSFQSVLTTIYPLLTH